MSEGETVDAPIPFAGCLMSSAATPGRRDLVMAGLPDDSSSSYRRGSAQAPAAVRRAYDGRCFNSSSESGVDLSKRILDLGDWKPPSDRKAARSYYCESSQDIVRSGAVPFFLGGDHGITPPLVKGFGDSGPLEVIQIDAHPDLYEEYQGNRWSHASTALRLLEIEHVVGLTQIGIRASNPLQENAAARFGDRIRVYRAESLGPRLPYPDHIPSDHPVYLTLDMDALDPAYAPGVSHPVPGGLTPRMLLDWIRDFPWRLAGMDLVEVNPTTDVNNLTSILAGRLLHQAMALAWQQNQNRRSTSRG